MIGTQNISAISSSNNIGQNETTLFSIPIGRLGLLSRLLISGACAFMVFLTTFFLAIVGVSIYDHIHGISIENLNIAYLYIAAPVGILAMLVCLLYLVGDWARNKFSAKA